MRLTKTRVLGLWMGAVVLAGSVCAGTYYVSPDSASTDWAAAENIATPCTVQTAFDNAQAGDIVQFRGGVYVVPANTTGDWLSGYYAPNHSGTEDARIVFMAYPDERPVFDGTSGSYDKDGHGHGNFARIMSNTRYVGSGSKTYHEYITFDGFTFQCDGGLNEGKITLTGGDNGSTRPRVRGLIVQNCTFNGGTSDNAARVQIDGVWTGTGDNHEGLFISQTTGLIIRNCRVFDYASANHNMNTSAIKTYHSDNMLIENCEVYDSSHGVYSKSNTDSLTVRYCYIHDNNVGFFAGTTGWWNDSNDHSKGYFVSENTDNVLLHNVFSNNTRGTISGFTQGGGDLDGFSAINNTIVATSGYTASVGLGSGERQLFYNNIIFGPKIDNDIGLLKWYCPNNNAQEVADGKPEHNFGLDACDHNQFGDLAGNFLIRVKKPDESTVSYPTMPSWQASGVLTEGGNPGAGSLVSNPLFVNASGAMTQLSDFALQANSPCKGAGRGGVDMGANIALVGPQDFPMPNRPPVLAPIGNRSVPAGQTLQITVQATDADGDALQYSAAGGQ
ncbi:MAG: right-handed parallel beta-helix repeat-containing protein [Opitutales bacterium]|nr:right-handed parallel beta-helix repeat-containing protein [Opitutales bacterium]